MNTKEIGGKLMLKRLKHTTKRIGLIEIMGGINKMAYARKKEITHTLNKKIQVIGVNSKYTSELNIVAWNNYEPKFDLRRWKDDFPTKGIALTSQEMENLKQELNKIDNFDDYMAEFTK